MKLRVEKAVYGGSGIARMSEGEYAGKAAFVPLTLPGELVEAQVVEDKPGFVSAEAESLIEPSEHRVPAPCPYFGPCGGCSYQHAEYAYQVELKTAILREALDRAHLSGVPQIDAVLGPPWGYRNRIRVHIQRGPFALAYYERRSNKLIAVSKCPIAAPAIENALVTVTEVGDSFGLGEFCDEIEFFSPEEHSLQLSFLARERHDRARPVTRSMSAICNTLKQRLPELKGAALLVSRGKRPPYLAQRWGDQSLSCAVAGHDYRVSAGAFFQVNRFLLEPLLELAVKDRKGLLAWDLYAGVGLFARPLASQFERVIAVELSPNSSADLRHNLQRTSSRVIEASTLDFLRKQKVSGNPPELALVDPPRAGLGAEVTSLLARIGPAEIVYVSCDPATLSRDLAALLQSGYGLRTITMVDMFPQTFHLESVSVLTRR